MADLQVITPNQCWRYEDADGVVTVYLKDGETPTFPVVLWLLAMAQDELKASAHLEMEEDDA